MNKDTAATKIRKQKTGAKFKYKPKTNQKPNKLTPLMKIRIQLNENAIETIYVKISAKNQMLAPL